MRKILSLLLATCLLLSCSVSIFADDGHSTKVRYVGEGSAEWELDVPSQLAPGESGNVILTGTWDSVTTVNVTADETVTLTNDVDESTKTLGITFANINQVGNMDNAIEVTKPISVSEITGGLFGVWEGIFNYYVVVNDISNPLIHNYIIPEGGVYYTGVVYPEEYASESYYKGSEKDYLTGTKYNSGSSFPTLNIGDVYIYDDYEYRYGMYYSSGGVWWEASNYEGWGVLYLGDSSEPHMFLEKINGKPVTHMNDTFSFNSSNITKFSVIPKNIVSIKYAFFGCNNLTGNIYIESNNIIEYQSCFESVSKYIGLSGNLSEELLLDIARTSNDLVAVGNISKENNILLINFEIDNKVYTAELNQTWSEWLSSSYNTDGYHYHPDACSILNSEETGSLVYADAFGTNREVQLDEEVLAGWPYMIKIY